MKFYKSIGVIGPFGVLIYLVATTLCLIEIFTGDWNILRILIYLLAIASLTFAMCRVFINMNSIDKTISKERQIQPNQPNKEPRTVIRLLKSILPSDGQQENIIGDLLEEYNQFSSRIRANLWLYKQVITSIFPLVYKVMPYEIAPK
jgi:hypothetical protein